MNGSIDGSINVIELVREKSIEEVLNGGNPVDFEHILKDIRSYGVDTTIEFEEVDDPFCDPDNPIRVPFQEVTAASFMIRSGIEKTPCDKSRMSEKYNMELYFKKDFLQYTGSFKERGARYTLMSLTRSQKALGVIAASAGNHALGLAYHGKKLNVPIIVVMPKTSPLMKQELCQQLGANVILHGADFGMAKKFALAMAKKHDILYINGYDHPHILAGQGTMGIEIVEQVPDLDAIIIPIGGGGLAAGVALAIRALKPKVKIYGVESENAAGFSGALKAGHPTLVTVQPTLADGLAVPMVGCNAFATLKPLLDKMVVVQEEFIALAILRLVEMEKCVVEGAGATGLAAILSNAVPELEGKKVVCVLCGGNIDTTVLGRVLERGLATDGRICRFVVNVSDRPGGIAELTRLIASIGVSLKDIFHERAWLKSDVYSVQVRCIVETRNMAHFMELKTLLSGNYTYVNFGDENSPIIM